MSLTYWHDYSPTHAYKPWQIWPFIQEQVISHWREKHCNYCFSLKIRSIILADYIPEQRINFHGRQIEDVQKQEIRQLG